MATKENKNVSKYIAGNISTINEHKNQLTIYCLKHNKKCAQESENGAWCMARNLYKITSQLTKWSNNNHKIQAQIF